MADYRRILATEMIVSFFIILLFSPVILGDAKTPPDKDVNPATVSPGPSQKCKKNQYLIRNCMLYICVKGKWVEVEFTATEECCMSQNRSECATIKPTTMSPKTTAECQQQESTARDCWIYTCVGGKWQRFEFTATETCCSSNMHPKCKDVNPATVSPGPSQECKNNQYLTRNCMIYKCVKGRWEDDAFTVTEECCMSENRSECANIIPTTLSPKTTAECQQHESTTRDCWSYTCVGGKWKRFEFTATEKCCSSNIHPKCSQPPDEDNGNKKNNTNPDHTKKPVTKKPHTGKPSSSVTQSTTTPPSDHVTSSLNCFFVDQDSTGTGNKNPGGRPNSGNKPDSCPTIVVREIRWPHAKAGETKEVRCKGKSGYATWECGGDPVCWIGEPNTDECASPAFQDLLNEAKSTANDSEPISSDKAEEVSSALVALTSSTTDITSADLDVSVSVIKNVGKSKPKNKQAVKNIMKNVVRAGSNLVSENQTNSWSKMSRPERTFSASKLMRAIGTTADAMVESIEEPTVITTEDENIEMELHVIDTTVTDTDLTYSSEKGKGSFAIPGLTLKEKSKRGRARVVFITHLQIGAFLDGDVADVPHQSKNPARKPHVSSIVISASLGTAQSLPEPVNFTLKHSRNKEKNEMPLCSFWNFSLGLAGQWSQQGCNVLDHNNNETSCQCDHLTNFAILLDVQGVEIEDIHRLTLSYITYIGCIISLICLLISWISFQFISSIQSERNSVHKHLAFCLFVAELLFLVGVSRTENPIACSIVAAVLHFFFLAVFIWMLIEGVHILVMLIQVFDADRSRLIWYCVFGYVTPAVVVAISAGVYHQGYGTETYCWLTTERHFIWSFAGPVAVILLVNAVILTYAMVAVCRHADYIFSKGKEKGGNLRGWIQGCLALEVLLGLTWVLGYLYISHDAVAMAYVFTICNSLQGLFIFICHCLLNKKVRIEYKRILHIKTDKRKDVSDSTRKTSSLQLQTNSTLNHDHAPDVSEEFSPMPTC